MTNINVNLGGLDRFFKKLEKQAKTNEKLSSALLGCTIYIIGMGVIIAKQDAKIKKLTKENAELKWVKGE